jgi:preprotein translocase subunit SecF
MQFFPLKLIPATPSLDFMRSSGINLMVSILLIVGSFSLVLTKGLNLGIDFAGGIVIEARASKAVNIQQVRKHLSSLNLGEVSIQSFGSNNDISIKASMGDKTEGSLSENVNQIKSILSQKFDSKFEFRKVDFVGPQVGSQLITSGLQAIILAFAAILIYIWIRFEWQFGIGIILALVHDVIIAVGFMSFSQYDFNLSSIAAILTIIGYSVNDTVVIYDRIRENLRKLHKSSINLIINKSINETLSRTVLTVITTLIANLALIIFGGEVLRSFSVMMFVGIIIGTYSSIFISAPLLTYISLKKFR